MVSLRRRLRFYCHPCLRLILLPWRHLRLTVAFIVVIGLPLLYFVNLDELYVDLGGDISDEYLEHISKTAACKLPNINPYHESILPFIKNLLPLECGVASATFENNVLRFESLNVVSVHYRIITRPGGNDDKVNVSEPIVFPNLLDNKMGSAAVKSAIEPGGYGCIKHKLSGKCLHPYGGVGLASGLQPVVFHEKCYGKNAYFKMEANGAIRHIMSGRCLRLIKPGSTGTSLTLHRKCDLKFELVNNYLKKKGSDLCVQSNSRRDDPANNEEIVLDGDCDSKRHEFHFVFVDGVPFKGEVRINTDFIRLDVIGGGNSDDFTEFHMQTSYKPEVANRYITGAGIPVNIIMILFDSTSAANFIRKMPKTYKYLNETLNTVFLKGQTVVGDGTTAQLSAMLTGIPERNQPESRKTYKNAKTVDNWRWIFKEYEALGYVTLYSEDAPTVAAFNYRLKGFRDPPTDHYGRYFWLEAENHISNELCTGNQGMHNVTFNYLLSLFRTYKKNPKFAFINFSTLVHREPNAIGHDDNDLLRILQTMEKESHLENSFVFIFGDHGYRFGGFRKQTLQGKLEERLPHFSITVPEWFTKRYSRLYNNLKFNSRLLTSPFDIYATLKHILSYPWYPKEVAPGHSLLKRLDPLQRVCQTASVRDHWCPCLTMEDISTREPIVKELALFAVSSINHQINETKDKLCRPLVLKRINKASREMPGRKVQTFKSSYKNQECDSCGARHALKAKNTLIKDTLYQIEFITSPNSALYEASVKVVDGHASIDGEISRLDSIKSQANCIKDTYVHLIKFCQCILSQNDES